MLRFKAKNKFKIWKTGSFDFAVYWEGFVVPKYKKQEILRHFYRGFSKRSFCNFAPPHKVFIPMI